MKHGKGEHSIVVEASNAGIGSTMYHSKGRPLDACGRSRRSRTNMEKSRETRCVRYKVKLVADMLMYHLDINTADLKDEVYVYATSIRTQDGRQGLPVVAQHLRTGAAGLCLKS